MSETIAPLDPAWFQRGIEYQARLTMPTGALGRILELGRRLCAIQETLQPRSEPASVVVMAADHGITAEQVSAYPQEVTTQMVRNFLAGGAAINVLARRQQARVLVVDMGVNHRGQLADLCQHPDFIGDLSVAPGTANFRQQPAMSTTQLEQALTTGRQVVQSELVSRGARTVALGEMGIGNTTSAAALAAALLGLPARSVTGRGTGVDDAAWQHKVDVIDQALALHFPGGAQVMPLEALRGVGGFEIAGLVGVALEAARHRLLVVLDGFISSVAGLLAARLEPAAANYFVASHLSVEVGHRAVLAALDLSPLFDLGLRLGEGSGAVLALGLIHSAADIMREMATFESAGVSDRSC